MALYLGNHKIQMRVGKSQNLIMNLNVSIPTSNGVYLISSDGFTLMDSLRRYIVAKETE